MNLLDIANGFVGIETAQTQPTQSDTGGQHITLQEA